MKLLLGTVLAIGFATVNGSQNISVTPMKAGQVYAYTYWKPVLKCVRDGRDVCKPGFSLKQISVTRVDVELCWDASNGGGRECIY